MAEEQFSGLVSFATVLAFEFGTTFERDLSAFLCVAFVCIGFGFGPEIKVRVLISTDNLSYTCGIHRVY